VAADAFDLPWSPAPPSPTESTPPTPETDKPSLQTSWDNTKYRVWTIAGGAVVLFGILLIAFMALRMPTTGPEQVQVNPQQAPANPLTNPEIDSQANARVSSPAKPSTPDRRHEPTPSPPEPGKKYEPPTISTPALKPPPVYDRFGNQDGNDIGLGKQNEFKGQRLLFWGGHTALPKVLFAPSNPIWKAFEEEGFAVRREFGAFKTEWLSETDQLWIVSSSTIDTPTMTSEQLEELLKLDLARNPPAKRPFGWSDEDFLLVERADYEVASAPKFPLDDAAYAAIEKFIEAGKGVCLLANNDPYINEANELTTRLYDVSVSGNYPGQRIAHVRQRELLADVIRKFKGAYEVDDHPLLAGINFVYEGITIGNVGVSDKLEVVMKASDGLPLLAVSKVPGQRVVIDCGSMRYCHGGNDETSFILNTAGSARLARNIAAYLAGKDGLRKR
jgi:hypothetical protein